MAYLTNAELWNECRAADSSFAAITSEATDAMFTERGFDALSNKQPNVLANFYAISLKVHLQLVKFAEVKDLFSEQDFGESFSGDIGSAIQQRIYQGILPCINPGWRDLEDGDSVDSAVVRKGRPEEDFWVMNEDIANLITIPDRFQYKGMFTSTYGMDIFSSGQAKSIVEGYKLQRYNDKKQGLYAGITSTKHPMRKTQKFETPDITDADSAIKFIQLVRDIVDTATISPMGAGGKFNAGGFANKIETGDLRLLARPRLFNQIATISRLNSPENMALPIKIVKVEDFGGTYAVINNDEVYGAGLVKVSNTAVPTWNEYNNLNFTVADATLAVDVSGATATKIYDNLGAHVADAYYMADIADIGGTKYTTIYIPIENATYVDPLDDVLCVIADKGVIFYNELNEVSIEPYRVTRGRYTNLWLSSPENGICYDHRRTLISVSKAS